MKLQDILEAEAGGGEPEVPARRADDSAVWA
jgi:hypothetical protein